MTKTIEEILDMDPLVLAKDEESKKIYIEYLRSIRENVVALEALGKPITKKASKTKQAQQEKPFDLSQLAKDS